MDEGRLGDVRRREDTHRKYMCVINDVVKSRWEILDEYIKRDKHETVFRMEKSVMSVRKSLVKQRVLQQCMKMRRDGLKYSETILGRYGGKAIESFSRDVENVIEDMHPKRRHMRKIQRLKLQSVRDGAILLQPDVEMKINDYFKRILTGKKFKPSKSGPTLEERIDIFKDAKSILPPIRGIMNSFHKLPLDPEEHDNKQQNEDKDVNKLKNIKDKASVKRRTNQKNIIDENVTNSDRENINNTKTGKSEQQIPSIVLPPIENGKKS